jgi:hypothetical protein
VIATTLVAGGSARARELAISSRLETPASGPGIPTAIILEGLPDGSPVIAAGERLSIARIAPGCLCCSGNLVLRVTLNRALRSAPQRLFIGLADVEHADRLRSWLQATPYDQLLAVGASVFIT